MSITKRRCGSLRKWSKTLPHVLICAFWTRLIAASVSVLVGRRSHPSSFTLSPFVTVSAGCHRRDCACAADVEYRRSVRVGGRCCRGVGGLALCRHRGIVQLCLSQGQVEV